MYIRICLLISLSYIVFLFGCSNNLNELTSLEDIDYQNDLKTQSSSMEMELDYQQITLETEPNNVLNLNHALALTLIHNPELKAYSFGMRAAEAHQLQEGLTPNPELEVEVEEFGGSSDRSEFESAETTFQLSQTIELGDKSQKRKKVASLEKEIAKINYQIAKSKILNEATIAYIQVLSAQEKLKISNQLLDVSLESFESVKKRVDAGKDSPLEIDRASIALSNIKIDNQQAYLDLENAKMLLASFWAKDILEFEQVAGGFYTLEPIEPYEYYSKLLINNPEFKLWEIEVKKSQAELDLEKSKSIVDMTIGAGIQSFNETDNNAFVFSMSIPLPISDRNQGARQKAIYNLAQKKMEQKAVRLNTNNLLSTTYTTYRNTFTTVTSNKKDILPAAANLYESAKTAYREGKIDYLNLLDAQRTLFEAQYNYINNLTLYHITKTNINKLINNQYTAIIE